MQYSPAWVGNEFRHINVRLIPGHKEALLRLEIIAQLCMKVDFKARSFQALRGEWQAGGYK